MGRLKKCAASDNTSRDFFFYIYYLFLQTLYTSIHRTIMSEARNAQPITLITGNKNKLKEFIAILGEDFQQKVRLFYNNFLTIANNLE